MFVHLWTSSARMKYESYLGRPASHVGDLTLSERTWICPNGPILDRDVNASVNILIEGLRMIGAERSDYADQGSNKVSKRKRRPPRSETRRSSINEKVY